MSVLDHRARRGWGLQERRGREREGIRDAVSPENHSGHTSLTHLREDAAEERTEMRAFSSYSYLNRYRVYKRIRLKSEKSYPQKVI